MAGFDGRHNLNRNDWARIEAALHEVGKRIESDPHSWHPRALAAYKRTLDKVQHHNKTGPYTPQSNGSTSTSVDN